MTLFFFQLSSRCLNSLNWSFFLILNLGRLMMLNASRRWMSVLLITFFLFLMDPSLFKPPSGTQPPSPASDKSDSIMQSGILLGRTFPSLSIFLPYCCTSLISWKKLSISSESVSSSSRSIKCFSVCFSYSRMTPLSREFFKRILVILIFLICFVMSSNFSIRSSPSLNSFLKANFLGQSFIGIGIHLFKANKHSLSESLIFIALCLTSSFLSTSLESTSFIQNLLSLDTANRFVSFVLAMKSIFVALSTKL